MSIGAIQSEADLARWMDRRLDQPSRLNTGLAALQGDVEGLQRVQPRLVSVLPSDPYDGQEIYFQPLAGLVWQFRYNQASPGAYKWEAVGAQEPLLSQQNGNTAYQGDSWAAPAAGDPVTVTLPLAGEYRLELQATGPLLGSAGIGVLSLQVGGTAPSADWGLVGTLKAGDQVSLAKSTSVVVPAGTVVSERGQVFPGAPPNTAIWSRRRLLASPRRVG